MPGTWPRRRRSSRRLRPQRPRRAALAGQRVRHRPLARRDRHRLSAQPGQPAPPGQDRPSAPELRPALGFPPDLGGQPGPDRPSGWRGLLDQRGRDRPSVRPGPGCPVDRPALRALRACGTLWASRTNRAGTSGAGGQGNRQDGKDSAQERSAGHRRLLPGEWLDACGGEVGERRGCGFQNHDLVDTDSR